MIYEMSVIALSPGPSFVSSFGTCSINDQKEQHVLVAALFLVRKRGVGRTAPSPDFIAISVLL